MAHTALIALSIDPSTWSFCLDAHRLRKKLGGTERFLSPCAPTHRRYEVSDCISPHAEPGLACTLGLTSHHLLAAQVTMMRGAQSGGVVTYLPGSNGLKGSRSRVVNKKRTDLSLLVKKKLISDVRSRSFLRGLSNTPRIFAGTPLLSSMGRP